MFFKPLLAGALSLLVVSKQVLGRPYVRFPQEHNEIAARDTSTCAVVYVTVAEAAAASSTATATSTSTATAAAASTTLTADQIGDFGSCSVPEIIFAVGLDGRKETAFEPANLTAYDHSSADNIAIITQFMCDQLVNTCGANTLARETCANATAAAAAVTSPTGNQADAFNAVFGITTDFAAVPVVNDQGVTQTISVTTSAISATATAAATTTTAAADAVSVTTSSSVAAATSTASAATIGNFGSCSVPEIEFGPGFDGRTETSFQPVDMTSYDHASADNIAVITSFICLALTNTCDADATAKATCQTAADAAAAATPALSGAQADAFNAAFGIQTDFAAVPVVSNTGVTESSDTATAVVVAATTSTAAATTTTTSAAVDVVSTSTTATATASAASASTTLTAAQIGDFGSCSVPEILFAAGLDGRTETAYQPVDLTSYNHGSADGIAVITSFICGQVDTACGGNALAESTCQTAAAAAAAAPAGTGEQADAFNAVFGIATDFASVTEINDQGQAVSS